MSHKYMIVSGFHTPPGCDPDSTRRREACLWFNKLWCLNLLKYANPPKVVIISTSAVAPVTVRGGLISLSGDLGCAGHILWGAKPHVMQACAAVWMAGLWLAYLNETDFIYLEQDALAFGPWVERLYSESDGRAAVFGRARMHGIATSLFMVRHRFIPQFVQQYLQEGRENIPKRIAEIKIARMADREPEHFAFHSFGYDTDRPINPKDEVFYAQQLHRHELKELELAGLISCDGMPDTGEPFSNIHTI